MSRDSLIELEGVITDVLPGNQFKVRVETNFLTCYLSGRLKQNKIRLVLGDSVQIEVSVYDWSKGRIIYRL